MPKTSKKIGYIRKSIAILSVLSLFTVSIASPVSALENSNNTASITNNEKYSIKYLSSLNYKDLIDIIKKPNSINPNEFFEFNKDTVNFYSDTNRLKALINALSESGYSYTKNDDKGVINLIEVIRAGYYIGAYHNELSSYRYDSFKSMPAKALNSIVNNNNFNIGTKTQNSIISSVGKLIGNSSANKTIVNKFSKVLDTFKSNFASYSIDHDKSTAVYDLINGVKVASNYEYQINNKNLNNTSYYKNIDSFITSLENLCTINPSLLNDKNEFIINNSIYFTGVLSKFKSNPKESQMALTQAMETYKSLPYQYFEAIQALDMNFNHKDYYGKTINMDNIKKELRDIYLPKEYSFDNGKFIVKAGDKVSEEKIKRMYWASKEVQSQFIRLIQNDKPLESNNPDDILTVVIYNSPKEYKLNQKLYGCNTDNGGIYIEKMGTFFTYERTPEESIYTLEELFRHEFTHYLQGRYLVNGMWGQGDFYKNNALTWYEEGSAEFFAGSTRTDGIKPRNSVVRNLEATNNNKMELPNLLHAGYGGWDFYNYGFAFSNYMYQQNPEMFKTICDFIKNNDINGYKNYINSISNKYNINNEYKQSIDKLVNNINNIDTPLVSDDYTAKHGYKNSKEMFDEIKSVAKLNDAKLEKQTSQFFNTFDIKGTYIGTKSNGKSNDFNAMNKNIDNALKELSKKQWLGYKTLTAYFTNYKVNSNGNYEYDVVIHGILNEDKNSKSEFELDVKPSANISSKSRIYTGENVEFNASNSTDTDGEITKYEWNFGDETLSNEKVANHSFKKTGNYTITLTVTDNYGKKDTVKKQVEVINKESSVIVNEIENNDRFDNSTKISSSNTIAKGTLVVNDASDNYSFEVKKEGEVTISLKNTNLDNVSWLLYDAKNTSMYCMYPDLIDNQLKNTMNLKPGKYYLNVYRFDRNASPDKYDVSIEGNLSDDKDVDTTNDSNIDIKPDINNKPSVDEKPEIPTNTNLKEIENNNSYEEAMPINITSVINSHIEKDDSTDIYKFSLDKDTNLNITLENLENLGLNWLLFSANDLNNYADYGKANNKDIKSNCTLKKGDYYLHVYSYDYNASGNYNIKLSPTK